MQLSTRDCEAYYINQIGGNGPHFHSAIVHQRGYGFFGDLRRFITPIAIRAGHYLGKRLFQTGKNVVSDVASGTSFRDSARSRLKEVSKKIKDDLFEKLQQGGAIKRKRSTKGSHLISTKAVKRRKTRCKDIFE